MSLHPLLVCRACASDPDPDKTEMEVAEAPDPPDGEPRKEVMEEISSKNPF